MITSIKKTSPKITLLVMAVILLISGCGMTNARLENNPKQPNTASQQSNRTETENQEIQKLSFQAKKMTQPEPKTPGKDWTITKEENIDDTTIVLYQADADTVFEPAFAKHAGNYYLLSSVYDAKTVKIQPLEEEFGGIQLIAGVGSDQTEWEVLGLDKNGKFVMFSVIGRPEVADLNGDGTKELVASFLGAHLNFPDVEILRVKNGHMESAKVIEAPGDMEDPQYARLVKHNGNYLIEIGKAREEGAGRQYRYDDGRLIPKDY